SWQRARDAGVVFSDEPPAQWDFGIDAMLAIGVSRAPEGRMAQWIAALNAGPPVLAVDVPSGLNADTGQGCALRAHHTLSLLTLKPGLFTGEGRDAAGEVWLDTLGLEAASTDATANLISRSTSAPRLHASHKGSYGDVAVIGGGPGMTGAALLAAQASLTHGAGRVFVSLLGASTMAVDASQPELMLRAWDSLDLSAMAVACGCGGGDAVRAVLPWVLSSARMLVLDADALNAIAGDSQLALQLQARARRQGRSTVITPHPLEAARLLGNSTTQVQADRLAAARALAQRFGCVAVLKGSGTVVVAPGGIPAINPTGNARLATAGTGDVLAGMVAANMAGGATAFDAACNAVHAHGAAADDWPAQKALTASKLAQRP
ncbi:MAG: NAD(P)H-hydrate dehydratase, partial [Ramlibacter sp.]